MRRDYPLLEDTSRFLMAGSRSRVATCRAVNRAKSGAFSMIELLLVAAILLLVVTLMWAPRSGRKAASRRAACQQQLQRVFIALQIYANEHSGAFPEISGARSSAQPLELLIPRYTSDTASFICPGKPQPLQPGQPLSKLRIGYAYYMGVKANDPLQVVMSDEQVNNADKALGHAVFSRDGKPPGNNHGNKGGNLLFSDGGVEKSSPQAARPLLLKPGVVLLNP